MPYSFIRRFTGKIRRKGTGGTGRDGKVRDGTGPDRTRLDI